MGEENVSFQKPPLSQGILNLKNTTPGIVADAYRDLQEIPGDDHFTKLDETLAVFAAKAISADSLWAEFIKDGKYYQLLSLWKKYGHGKIENNPILIAAARVGLDRALKKNHLSTVATFLEKFNLPGIDPIAMERMIEQTIQHYLSHGDLDHAASLAEKYHIPEEVMMFSAVAAIPGLVANGLADRTQPIIDKFKLPNDIVKPAVMKGVDALLEIGDIYQVKRSLAIFGINLTEYQSREQTKESGKRAMRYLWHAGYEFSRALSELEVLGLPPVDFKDFAADAYSVALKEWDTSKLAQIGEVFPDSYGVQNEKLISDAKKRITDRSLKMVEREKALALLAGFEIHKGIGVTKEYSLLLQQRTEGEGLDARGLSASREAALLLLLRVDSTQSNAALFTFMTDKNTHRGVRSQIAQVLSKEERNFQTNNFRKALKQFSAPSAHRDWRDLEFVKAFMDIPSTELREDFIAVSGLNIMREKPREYESWAALQEQFPNIPNAVIERIYFLQKTSDQSGLVHEFNIMYGHIKERSLQENLLYSINALCKIDTTLLTSICESIIRIGLKSKEDAVKLASVMRKAAFVDSIPRLLARGGR